MIFDIFYLIYLFLGYAVYYTLNRIVVRMLFYVHHDSNGGLAGGGGGGGGWLDGINVQ